MLIGYYVCLLILLKVVIFLVHVSTIKDSKFLIGILTTN